MILTQQYQGRERQGDNVGGYSYVDKQHVVDRADKVRLEQENVFIYAKTKVKQETEIE